MCVCVYRQIEKERERERAYVSEQGMGRKGGTKGGSGKEDKTKTKAVKALKAKDTICTG